MPAATPWRSTSWTTLAKGSKSRAVARGRGFPACPVRRGHNRRPLSSSLRSAAVSPLRRACRFAPCSAPAVRTLAAHPPFRPLRSASNALGVYVVGRRACRLAPCRAPSGFAPCRAPSGFAPCGAPAVSPLAERLSSELLQRARHQAPCSAPDANPVDTAAPKPAVLLRGRRAFRSALAHPRHRANVPFRCVKRS